VVVSAALKPEGMQRMVVLLALTKPARWRVSEAIATEYVAVLARPELRIRSRLRRQLLQLIEIVLTRAGRRSLRQGTADSGDNMFVECSDALVQTI
jgi:uncharacterized protein